LWGQPSARFYSTVEVENDTPWPLEFLEVSLDVDKVNLDDYAAVIVAANYTSVRLRWSEREDVTAANAADVARSVPAVRFFRRAMQNPKIIKGAACHALWLLTTSPDILAGRRVICNKVVLADVINAGGIYTPPPPNAPPDQHVVVDRDLVTNDSWHASAAFVDAIKDLIVNPPAAVQTEPAPAVPVTPGKRRVLIVLSE
jgi:protease I